MMTMAPKNPVETACYWSDNRDALQVNTYGPGEDVLVVLICRKSFLWFTWEKRSRVVLPWRMVGSLYRQLAPVRGMKP